MMTRNAATKHQEKRSPLHVRTMMPQIWMYESIFWWITSWSHAVPEKSLGA